MTEYGCQTSNKFGLELSSDDEFGDPRDLVRRAEALKSAPPVKPAPIVVKKEETLTKPTTSKVDGRLGNKDRGGRDRGRGRVGRGGHGGEDRSPRAGNDLGDRFGEGNIRGRGGPRGGRGGRGGFRGRGGNTNNSDDTRKHPFTADSASAERVENHRDSRESGGVRGRGGFRGRGRGRGREFDRHSGSDQTGVRSHDKKEGHGKGNWGDLKDEIAGETDPIATEGETQEPAAPREKTAEELQYEADLAEYNKLKTLKEFKAEQQTKTDEFKIRRAGEGSDENFGRLIPLKKASLEKEDDIHVVRKESSKKVIECDIRFVTNRGRGGDRFRQVAPRGRPSRRPSAYNASTEDFPALQ